MKVFLDTNVLVSAGISAGVCRDLLDRLEALKPQSSEVPHAYASTPLRAIQCVLSRRVLNELTDKLTQKLRLSPQRVDTFLHGLEQTFTVAGPAAEPVPCPDASDGWILADALHARSDYFITGDRAVLGLYAVESMRIITPREMMMWLHAGVPIPTIDAHEERAAYLARRLDSRA